MRFFSFPLPFSIKNADLIQDDVQNLKRGAVLDPHSSRATQTPPELLDAKESGMKTNWNFCFRFCAVKVRKVSFM